MIRKDQVVERVALHDGRRQSGRAFGRWFYAPCSTALRVGSEVVPFRFRVFIRLGFEVEAVRADLPRNLAKSVTVE